MALDPDPNWAKILDPEPNSIYLDPQHAKTVIFLCKFTTLLAALPVRYGEAARPLELGQHNDHLPAHVHIAQVVTKSATRNRDEDPDPHFLI